MASADLMEYFDGVAMDRWIMLARKGDLARRGGYCEACKLVRRQPQDKIGPGVAIDPMSGLAALEMMTVGKKVPAIRKERWSQAPR